MWPELNPTVAFQHDAADQSDKMREWEHFPNGLSPDRHATEREHKSGEQHRGKEEEKSHLHRLCLVASDGR